LDKINISSYGEIALIDFSSGEAVHIKHPPGRYKFIRIPNPLGHNGHFLCIDGTKIGASEESLRDLEYSPATCLPEDKDHWHNEVLLFSVDVSADLARKLRLEDEEMVAEVVHSTVDQMVYYRMGYNYKWPRVMYMDAKGEFGTTTEPWYQIRQRGVIKPEHQP
jgi:hypothetical protein